jgi:glycosidase
MIKALVHWVEKYNIDGYRFDMYWGPVSRQDMSEIFSGRPIRTALKSKKPDVFLIAEVDGITLGGGYASVVYAEQGGGVDCTYDWPGLWCFAHAYIKPKENLQFLIQTPPVQKGMMLRFTENHDEMRTPYSFNSVEKTLPVATLLLTAPGVPMIYTGQEIGYGLGMPRVVGMRSKVNWSLPGGEAVREHYRRLIHARKAYPALRSRKSELVKHSPEDCFAYARLADGQAALVVVNLSEKAARAKVTVKEEWLPGAALVRALDVFVGSESKLAFEDGKAEYDVQLLPFGSAIVILEPYHA